MKKLFILLLLMFIAPVANAQYPPWDSVFNRYDQHQDQWRRFALLELRHSMAQAGRTQLKLLDGVDTHMLDSLALQTIGSGRFGYFFGLANYYDGWAFPPGKIEPTDVVPRRRNFSTDNYYYCCGCGSIPVDSIWVGELLGFYWYDPNGPYNFWGINSGVTLAYDFDLIPVVRHPCASGPGQSKYFFCFTDSTYSCLPVNSGDSLVLEGDNPIYFKGHTTGQADSGFYARLYLQNTPQRDTLVVLKGDGFGNWTGHIDGCGSLGLKSYNRICGELRSGTILSDTLATAIQPVARPKIEIYTSTDTVFIRSDSMKIKENLIVGLRIVDDVFGNGFNPNVFVDTAGYKYKSRWTANANTSPQPYYRQYPRDNSYLEWNDYGPDCAVTFRRDSLAVVGGLLTIEAKGRFTPFWGLDGSFDVTTDTLTTNGDTIQTKRILIDKDPINQILKDSLKTDRARAIAWQEGAGTTNNQPPNRAMARWNHYWGVDSTHANNTRTPCEGDNSPDAGILQINRPTWEKVFNGTYSGNYPGGWKKCSWDSLTWNWAINIQNGRWIFNIAYPSKMTQGSQPLWPDSCNFADCDTVPDKPNKEDLSNYGYHAGEVRMLEINNNASWKTKITDSKDQYANYAKAVRIWKYRPNRTNLW